ncbi:MAG: metallopeptidase TldD-related protein [Kofleriaceae bacterium]
MNRREVLGGLGLASAHALWFAFGCGTPQRPRYRTTGIEASGEIRTWLRDAVALIHGAGLTGHALAVSSRHTVAAQDVLGPGVGHSRADGVVLTARDAHGRREQVTTDLTRDGVINAARRLAGDVAPGRIDFGPPPPPAPVPRPDPDTLADANLLDSIAAVAKRDQGLSSRIVYASGSLELDDAMVWSVAAGRDLEQRLFRVRRALTRVAWNGTRPIISEVSRAWSGGINDQTFSDEELAYARDVALALMTPGVFPDGVHELVLAPDVIAGIVDAAARTLYTPHAQRWPEVARRVAVGATVASPRFTLVDDPTVANAYGGFRFDDGGVPAEVVSIIEHGVLGRMLASGRRPGHVGPLEVSPSHLRVAPGTVTGNLVVDDGFLLEGNRGVLVDAASDRIVIAVQRALEVKHGQRTGRVYAEIELVGDLSTLLGSIGDATVLTRTIGIRDERDDLPRWRSVEAPWLRAKGLIRARRRST